MRKILIITPKFFPSIWWIEEQVKLLWLEFINQWYKVDILTNKFNKKLKRKEIIYWLNVFRFNIIIWLILFLIKNRKYSLIISRQYYLNSFILWLLKFTNLIKNKTIICADSWWNKDEINTVKKMLKLFNLYKVYFFFIWQNNYLNCLNKDNRKHLKSIYKWKTKYLNKITNIYNGINITEIKNKQISKIKNLLILSRFDYDKWVFETINAFKQIKNKNIKLHLVWYWEKSVEEQIKRLIKNDKRIIFHWKKYEKEKEEIINNTDLFILASHHEWQPVTLTEMALNNIPIISTDVANNKEIYSNNIIYTKKWDVIDLKNKIEKVIKNINKLEYNYAEVFKKINIKTTVNNFLSLK